MKGHSSTRPAGLARFLTGLIIALSLSLPVAAKDGAHPYQKWADEFGLDLNVSYDGVRVIEMRQGSFEAIERRAPGKMYTEVMAGNMTAGVILREDLEKSYILMPSMGVYKEESLKGGMMQSSNGMEFSQIEKAGREEINGHPSTKYKTRFKDKEGKGAGFVWVTDTGVPIKMDMIYSNKDLKGERITMQFTELNLREQDPAVFELPPNLKPMGLGSLGDLMKMGAQPQAADTAPSAAGGGDLSDRQQACLEEAARAAEQQRESEKKSKRFGRLLGKMARTANRLGLSNKMGSVSRDIYDTNATAADVADIADELGITTEDVERCRNPS